MDVASRLGLKQLCWADEGKCRVTRQSVGGGGKLDKCPETGQLVGGVKGLSDEI